MVDNSAAGTPDWWVLAPQFLSSEAPWRLVAGGGCAACARRGSPYSKAVRCSSPIRWAAARSWRPGTARASPGRSGPDQARSLTRGAQVRRPGLLALDLGEPLTPTSDLETPGLDPQAVTINSWPESSAGPLISACTLEADCPSPDLPFHPWSLSLLFPGSPSPPTLGSPYPPAKSSFPPIPGVSFHSHSQGLVSAHHLVHFPHSRTEGPSTEHRRLHLSQSRAWSLGSCQPGIAIPHFPPLESQAMVEHPSQGEGKRRCKRRPGIVPGGGAGNILVGSGRASGLPRS